MSALRTRNQLSGDGQTRPYLRRGPALVILAVLALAALTAIDLHARLVTPSDGTVVVLSASPWSADTVTVDRVLQPGSLLQPGDEVVAIDGRPLNDLLHSAEAARLRAADQLTYDVRRGDELLQVPVTPTRLRSSSLLEANWSAVILLVSLLGVAGFVFVSRPEDPATRALMLVAGLGVPGTTWWALGTPVSELVLATGPPWRLALGELSLTLLWGVLWQFVVVFGDVPFRRWRGLMPYAGYLGAGLSHAGYVAAALPAAHTPLARLGCVVPVSLMPGYLGPVALISLIAVTYRRTVDARARRRLLWVLAALGASLFVFIAVWLAPAALLGRPLIGWGSSLLAFVPAPLALGAAILRYRLFDIEIILRRSLLYGSLTAATLALYLLVAWLVGLALPARREADLVALGVALLTFPALRAKLLRVTGRLVYGERVDPHALLARLDRLDLRAPGSDTLRAVAETVARRLRLPYAAIELYGPAGGVEAQVEYGTPRPEYGPTRVPLRWGERDVGLLLLDVGPGREPFGPADRRLLDQLARHLAGTAYTVLLASALQASRVRLVTAREEERRRLGRDLHDGLGPTLAACALHIDAAREVLAGRSPEADALLGHAVTTVQAGMADIRRLVDDLRPPALDQLGLEAALREQALRLGPAGAGTNLPEISVEVTGGTEELSAAVEVAVLRIVAEALHNAIRHGQASRCEVRVQVGADVAVLVSDNGAGLPLSPRAGVGMISMRERASELGGTCTVGRGPDGGTVVSAQLPLRAERIPGLDGALLP